jgi:hypothetical protein
MPLLLTAASLSSLLCPLMMSPPGWLFNFLPFPFPPSPPFPPFASAPQPLLGVEGDPMRLLFERDLTPHPQYAAFYKWMQQDFAADAVLHFGMHGTGG